MLLALACADPDKPADSEQPGTPTPVGPLALEVDAEVVTMVHATWSDPLEREGWVEYRFEGEEWRVAPLLEPGLAVLLGIPAEAAVEARVVAQGEDGVVYSDVASTTTGSLPKGLLLPEIVVWDASSAYGAEYVMISVAHGDYTFSPPYWIQILDRQGRIVWYQETPDSLITFFATVALDGTHLWWEGSDIFGAGVGRPRVVRQTLDGRWSTTQGLLGMGEAIAEGPDYSWYVEMRSGTFGVVQVLEDGSQSTLWDCGEWMAERGLAAHGCYLNACNWSGETGTVLASSFTANNVFEVDVSTGEVRRQMGQLGGSDAYTFDPPAAMFDYQHYPYWLENGNLLVSTHEEGVPYLQVAAEYEVDDASRTLTRVWSYTSTDRWATQVGEALRLPNGNTVQGYGQDGAVREVTADGVPVWEAVWPRDLSGYRVVGHASFLTDLYALNRGPG
jgi:hypothetical protein